MSTGISDSESISECKFETTSESEESIRGCYNNEPEYNCITEKRNKNKQSLVSIALSRRKIRS